MKRPEISTRSSDPKLAGNNEATSWVVGRNCVYEDKTIAGYRVSIRTPRGWKSYGHFNDLETATYVANIAILAERCEEKYELNEGIGEKNREEIDRWRRQPGNIDLEKSAAERYKKVKADLAALQERERIEAEKTILESKQKREIRQKKRDEDQERIAKAADAERSRKILQTTIEIKSLNGQQLVQFIKSTDPYDPFYKIALAEARIRLRK